MASIKMTYEGDLRVDGDFSTDVSEKWGGIGEYPTPTDLLAGSLGSCILSIMAMKANSLGFDLTGTTIEVEKVMDASGHFKAFTIIVDCSRPIDQKTAEKLEKAAHACPVHHAIDSEIEQDMTFKWNFST